MSGADQRGQRKAPGWAAWGEITPGLLSRCLDIIGSTEDKRQSCCDYLDTILEIVLGTSRVSKDELTIAYGWSANAIRREVERAKLLTDAATLLKEEMGFFVSNTPGVSIEELNLTGQHLALVAAANERRVAGLRTQTRPPDVLKTSCAVYAFVLLKDFSSHPPTLTDGGAFRQLAAVLYEAATGFPEGSSGSSVESQCRWVFHHRSDLYFEVGTPFA